MHLPLKLYSLDNLTKNNQQQKEKFQEKMEENSFDGIFYILLKTVEINFNYPVFEVC